jgi:hypothetical protein
MAALGTCILGPGQASEGQLQAAGGSGIYLKEPVLSNAHGSPARRRRQGVMISEDNGALFTRHECELPATRLGYPNLSANTGRIPSDAQASKNQLLLLGNLPVFKDATELLPAGDRARRATGAPAPLFGWGCVGHERAPEAARSGNEGDQDATRPRSVVALFVPPPESELPAFILQ